MRSEGKKRRRSRGTLALLAVVPLRTQPRHQVMQKPPCRPDRHGDLVNDHLIRSRRTLNFYDQYQVYPHDQHPLLPHRDSMDGFRQLQMEYSAWRQGPSPPEYEDRHLLLCAHEL
jgi:hypothetical protein